MSVGIGRIVWWCPTCKQPVMRREPCPKCKTERVASWRCDQCKEIVVGKAICGCGRRKAQVIYNRMIIKNLFEETGPTGHKNIDIIRRFAYSYATGHNLPTRLVEDAIGETLYKIVKGYNTYEQSKPFRTWAIAILKNTLADAATKDIAEGEMLAFSIDAEVGDDDGDSLAMESVLGYTFGVDDLISAEDKVRYKVMATLARKAFGYIATVDEGGEYAEVSVYDLAVTAHEGRDGYGWMAEVSRRTGLSSSLLNRRQNAARRTWKSWNRQELEQELGA